MFTAPLRSALYSRPHDGHLKKLETLRPSFLQAAFGATRNDASLPLLPSRRAWGRRCWPPPTAPQTPRESAPPSPLRDGRAKRQLDLSFNDQMEEELPPALGDLGVRNLPPWTNRRSWFFHIRRGHQILPGGRDRDEKPGKFIVGLHDLECVLIEENRGFAPVFCLPTERPAVVGG